MKKYFILLLMASLFGLLCNANADESVNYNQRTLPNGDVENSYSSSDGNKIVSLQHPDGSAEITTTAADGTKSVSIQHKDGSVDTHVTQPAH